MPSFSSHNGRQDKEGGFAARVALQRRLRGRNDTIGERHGAHVGAGDMAGQICDSRTKFVRANKLNSGNAHERNCKHKHKFVFVFATRKGDVIWHINDFS